MAATDDLDLGESDEEKEMETQEEVWNSLCMVVSLK